jgi:hypothetical protein
MSKFYGKENPFFKKENVLVEPASTSSIIKPITSLECRKPHKTWWVRAHPSEDFRLVVALVEGQEGEREEYLVGTDMVDKVGGVVTPVELSAAITRGHQLFMWRVPLVNRGKDRENVYNTTHRDAHETARERWVRMFIEQGAYRIELEKDEAASPDPVWPDLTFEQMMQLAFGDRYIDSENSPRFKELKGLRL